MTRAENLDKILLQLSADHGFNGGLPKDLPQKQMMMRALMNTRQPVAATDDFLKAQDAELQLQNQDKGIVTIADIAEKNNCQLLTDDCQFLLWQGDITRLKVDAIVNAANAQMLGCWHPLHKCIDNCIHSAAGVQLRQECYEIMRRQGHDEPTGTAKITMGYNLPAKHVIHTVGPIVAGDVPTAEQEKQLASCYRSCLEIAEENHLTSISFCCISTGVFRFPNRRAAEIAVATVREYPHKWLKNIVFNVFLDKDYEIYRQLL